MVRGTIIGERRSDHAGGPPGERGPVSIEVELGSVDEAIDVARERGLALSELRTESGRIYRPDGEGGLTLAPSRGAVARGWTEAGLVALSIVLPPVGLLIGVPLFFKDRNRGGKFVSAAFIGGFLYSAVGLIRW